MNCRKIKELLMTDYLDDELSEARKREVQKHLDACQECRQFELILRRTAVEPFNRAGETTPPDSVWNRIKEAIGVEKGRQAQGLLADLRDRLYAVFPIRKPVFAAAAIMAVILAAAVVTRLPFENQKAVDDYLEEQMDFFVYLDDEAEDLFDTDYMYVNLGTSIEEFLL